MILKGQKNFSIPFFNKNMNIVLIIIGLIIGSGITIFILTPKLKNIQQLNIEIQNKNREIQNELVQLNDKKIELVKQIAEKQSLIDIIGNEINQLNFQKDSAENVLNFLNNKIKDNNELLKQHEQIAQENFEKSLTLLAQKYSKAEEDYQKEYSNILSEMAYDLKIQIEDYTLKLNYIHSQLEKEQSITNAAIEANKRALAEAEKIKFYQIQLSEQDLEEIEKVRSIAPYLRNREPLDKIVWKSYYEKPTSNLLSRVVGATQKTGIYKITNLITGMIYIGQSVNIADRFKAHIKAGLGIDSSNNELYTAMKQYGVENFTFEILEECSRADLNEQEKFWIKYYQSNSFGYNMTRGGS